MNRTLLYSGIISLLSTVALAQDRVPIHQIRLGDINNSTTTYKGSKPGVKELKISYKDILENPKLTCETGDCVVTHFTCSIIPKGHDIYGPYSTDGADLKDNVKNPLRELADANDKSAKIVIEDIRVTRGGREEAVKGALLYGIK